MFARSVLTLRATRGMIFTQIFAAPFAVKPCYSSGFVDTCEVKTIGAVVPAVGQYRKGTF